MEKLNINVGQSATNISKEKLQKTTTISINDIVENPLNKKVYSDSNIDEMIESLKIRELITPIMVVRTTDGKYRTISGHRRIEACRNLFSQGLSIKYNGTEYKDSMPAIIHEPFATEEDEIKALVDANNQREKSKEEKKNEALALYGKLKELKQQGNFTRGAGEITQVVADQMNVSKNTIKNWVKEDKHEKPQKEKTDKIGCFPKKSSIVSKIKKFGDYLETINLEHFTEDEQKEVREELEKIKNKMDTV